MDVREKLVQLIDEIIELYPSERKELADGLIANGVTVQEWIPVTERLPDGGVEVLVYSKIIGICVDYYDGDTLGYSDVTHWMPLPQPPKGE